jgi:malonate-semialdehyde dehydrogenase (acetylating) / methylmalonate-semialdehyde dehydrogenase
LRELLKANNDEIARTITTSAAKPSTSQSRDGARHRNVEVACGIPMMMKGEIAEDIAPGIDELMIRQPVGVCATIAPFQLPRHDSVLVPALCPGDRQHLHYEAF